MISPTSPNTQRKSLPTGIQTFSKIRQDDCYYVDKTPLILEMIKEDYIFLSRPRRFGKSLTLDTIAELFSGNQSLFTGLYAEKHWDWSKTHPVIRLSFGMNNALSYELLQASLQEQFDRLAEDHNLTFTATTYGGKLSELIRHCYTTSESSVVILVDEYDKPMLDSIGKNYLIEVRDQLRYLYNAIKENDKMIRFAMLTGVSKFSKVNIFSGINNLIDITLDPKFSALCGYTQDELESVFALELEFQGCQIDLDKLRAWYNGYQWGGESVYNPYDVLLFFRTHQYQAHWFETASSAWLIDNLVIKKLNMHTIENTTYDSMRLASFDIDEMNPIAILFQTGYLTINEVKQRSSTRYTLKYPNIEVQQSLNRMLIEKYVVDSDYEVINEQEKLYDYLLAEDFNRVEQVFRSFFASIPHQWYDTNNNQIATYEGHWASVFYGFLTGLGVRVHTEESTNKGRLDARFEFQGAYYVIEFKMTDGSQQENNPALSQIKDKGYYEKFTASGQPIYLMGIIFDKEKRNISSFEVEKVA